MTTQKKLPNGLTPREDDFARQLSAHKWNGTQAAIAAGYSAKTAAQAASRLLSKVNVLNAAIGYAEEAAAETKASTQWIIEQLILNVEKCGQAVPVLDKQGNPTGEYRFDSSGSNSALRLLGQNRGMWLERMRMEIGPEVKAILDQMQAIVIDEVSKFGNKHNLDSQSVTDAIAARVSALFTGGGNG